MKSLVEKIEKFLSEDSASHEQAHNRADRATKRAMKSRLQKESKQ